MLSPSNPHPFKAPVSPLQVLLLIQLDAGPKYGYEMVKQLKDSFQGTWEPKTGTIYPALKSLERRGYVAVNKVEGKDYYQLTEKGQRVFDTILQHLESSLDFSIKYLAFIFRWMSTERKQSALRFMERLSQKEQVLSGKLLESFTESLEPRLRRPFLEQMRVVTLNRLRVLDQLVEAS